MGSKIVSTGCFVPENEVTNEDLGELGYDADWILQRTGIKSRRRAPDDMATSDMAVEAARACIEKADVNPHDIDLVIVATMTPDTPVPSTACVVQDQLNLCAPAMDINAACAGFMYALVTGMQFVKCGTSKLALIIGADTNTRIVDPADRKTFPLFGDGAGAVLLGASNKHGLISYTLGAEGEGGPLLGIKAGGSRHPLCVEGIAKGDQYIHMDGRSVFKWAVRLLSDSIHDVLAHASLEIDDIDLVVLHQANARIIDAAAESIGIDRDRIIVNLDRFGNTSAASIPICMTEAVEAGRLQPGHRVLLCGFGAGLAWGTAIQQW
jgi:3-oxoacyl-[acyl-carrier-protein] synthase-3